MNKIYLYYATIYFSSPAKQNIISIDRMDRLTQEYLLLISEKKKPYS